VQLPVANGCFFQSALSPLSTQNSAKRQDWQILAIHSDFFCLLQLFH
jgi:hypothetical protein